jgi:dephospho-CoA kinase
MLPKIENAINAGQKRIILESMYNVQEFEVIKEKYKTNFRVIAIHADRQVRMDRLNKRKERSLSEEELTSREVSEAKKLWKGTLIAMADYHMLNNGTDLDKYTEDMRQVFADKLGL